MAEKKTNLPDTSSLSKALDYIGKNPGNLADLIYLVANNDTLYSWSINRIKKDRGITNEGALKSRTQTLDFVHDFSQAIAKGKYSDELKNVFLEYLKLEDVPFAGVERDLNLNGESTRFLREKILKCPDEKTELSLSDKEIAKRLQTTCKKDFALFEQFLATTLRSHISQHYTEEKFVQDLIKTAETYHTSIKNPSNQQKDQVSAARSVIGKLIQEASANNDNQSRKELVNINGDLKLKTLTSTASIMQGAVKPRSQSEKSPTTDNNEPPRRKAVSAEARMEKSKKKARRRALGRAGEFDPEKLKALREQVKEKPEANKESKLDPATGLPLDNKGGPPPKRQSKGKGSASEASESSNEDDAPKPQRPRR